MRPFNTLLILGCLLGMETGIMIMCYIMPAPWLAIIGLLIPIVSLAFVFRPNVPRNKSIGALQPISFLLAVSFILYWLIVFLKGNDTLSRGNSASSSMDKHFEQIRNNEAALTAFFASMPKGGDLHNHFSGSIYAESYLEDAINNKFWIEPSSLLIVAKLPKNHIGFQRLDTICNKKDFPALKQRLFQEWSVKDYYDALRPSDKHFFDAFGKFPKNETCAGMRSALIELKKRAKAEHMQYLEIMLASVPVQKTDEQYNDRLRHLSQLKEPDSLYAALENLYGMFDASTCDSTRIFIDSLHKVHQFIDDNEFTMRYLCFVKREAPPVQVFQGLMSAFKAAQQDSLIGGVNIVSPEDGALAMKDYMLHMHMFWFLRQKYKQVNCSLHAGELTLGLVKPEDLSWHINAAVYTGGAKRIGHGVDLPYEKNCDSLLEYMRRQKIAVEINLISNQFILKVRDDSHPILMYNRHQVPIVISTDDAGILRTSQTAQFVALAQRYPELKYEDIKRFIQNSITFSFIKEPQLKQKITQQLDRQLAAFEQRILKEK